MNITDKLAEALRMSYCPRPTDHDEPTVGCCVGSGNCGCDNAAALAEYDAAKALPAEPAKASDIEKTVLDVLDPAGAEVRQLQDDEASARMELRRIIAARMPSVTFRPLSRYDFDVAAAAYDENAHLHISHRVRLCRALKSILPHGMPDVGGDVQDAEPSRRAASDGRGSGV